MNTSKSGCPRLIFLTQFYDPEPVYKGQSFAEELLDMGYEVEVVTAFPNYPGGKVYDGYHIRPLIRENKNGVKITRLAMYPSHGKSKIGRVANYVSFFVSAFIYLCWVARRADLLYVYHPPLTVGLAAAASRSFHRTPVIVDIHDLWPDTLPATGMITNSRILDWVDKAAIWMYHRVQFIILHTHGFREKLLERGVPAEKMQTVLGWTNEYSLPETQSSGVEVLTKQPGLKILYAGNMGPAQDLDAVLDAATLLQQKGHGKIATLCLMGDGISQGELQRRIKEFDLTNVVFLPRVAPDEVGCYLNAADVLLVHLRDSSLFEITLPSKTQAYMYAGKPIIMGVPGEAARLIENARAGISVKSGDPEELVQAIEYLVQLPTAEREAMGQRGYCYYIRELAMAKGLTHFREIFCKVRSVTRSDDKGGTC